MPVSQLPLGKVAASATCAKLASATPLCRSSLAASARSLARPWLRYELSHFQRQWRRLHRTRSEKLIYLNLRTLRSHRELTKESKYSTCEEQDKEPSAQPPAPWRALPASSLAPTPLPVNFPARSELPHTNSTSGDGGFSLKQRSINCGLTTLSIELDHGRKIACPAATQDNVR